MIGLLHRLYEFKNAPRTNYFVSVGTTGFLVRGWVLFCFDIWYEGKVRVFDGEACVTDEISLMDCIE